MLSEDKYFNTLRDEELWQRYCGFFDLSMEDFLRIQNELLMDQIERVHGSILGKKIMGDHKPRTVEEFRQIVPLTTYDDYEPYLSDRREDVLAEKPCVWMHTSGKSGHMKWVPVTEQGDDIQIRSILGVIILSMSSRKGEVNLAPGVKVLSNLPPRPYASGCVAFSAAKRFTWYNIPPLELYEKMEFQERIEKGFQMALRSRVDVVISMSSVLIKLGDSFTEGTRKVKFSWSMLHPRVLYRFARATATSRREGRSILPKDLWPVKSVVSWGTDTGVYKEKIKNCWGRDPYEFYVFTEAVGYTAFQNWNKKAMTFSPYSSFLEFIPEKEWLKWREDKNYQPKTVLLDEVQENQIYEVVSTNFYGMPFLRYRVGDLIKISALKDEETGVKLPQMTFHARADEVIDLSGFTRLDERLILQAVANTGIKHNDWTARKEYDKGDSFLNIYMELKEDADSTGLAAAIHSQLKSLYEDYKNLAEMLGKSPLRVTLLPKGAFKSYFEAKKAAGYDLAHLRPPRMNASDKTISDLLQVGESKR